MATKGTQIMATKVPKLSSTDDMKWQREDDVRTLKRHAEITSDIKRHAAAKAHAKSESDMLRKVAGRTVRAKKK